MQSPLRSQTTRDLQASQEFGSLDSPVSISETYDHTIQKWKSLSDVYVQCKMSIIEPEDFSEVVKDEAWKKAMTEEMLMIEKNSTWELVDRPCNKPIVGVKWVYKTKLNLDGSIQKHKARLVAKGYTQKPRVDYNETFAPVARLDTIRILIALAAQKGWKLWQLDVKSVFLNGVLEKKAPMAWYSEIDTYLIHCGFHKSSSEATLYVWNKEGVGTLIVSIYVDDVVYTGSSAKMMEEFKAEMMCKYEVLDLDLLHHFLGMGPVSTPLVATDKLKREDEIEPTNESLYKKIVGSLLYLTTTRLDIMLSASLLARFMHKPSKKHYGAPKRVLRYVQGTIDFGIEYVHSVALSTAEAEYVNAAEATSQAIWLKFVLEDFGEEQAAVTTLFCDNTSAIAMSKNPVFHQRTKHIGKKFHLIIDTIQEGVIDLVYCKGEE
ncbi:unnamed protein product [Prunus armeniaca]